MLVYCEGALGPGQAREVFEAWWRIPYEAAPDEQGWWCYDKDSVMLSADVHGMGATHWMPLPPSPGPEPPA